MEITYMEELGALVPGTNIIFATEWANGHSIFINSWQIVRESTVNIANPMEFRGQ